MPYRNTRILYASIKEREKRKISSKLSDGVLKLHISVNWFIPNWMVFYPWVCVVQLFRTNHCFVQKKNPFRLMIFLGLNSTRLIDHPILLQIFCRPAESIHRLLASLYAASKTHSITAKCDHSTAQNHCQSCKHTSSYPRILCRPHFACRLRVARNNKQQSFGI